MRIYVGNLSYRSSEQDVHKAFTAFGEVARTQLAIDPETGRSAGFAYVEMPNEEEAQTAIARLNGKEINSRVVAVSLATAEQPAARPERERSERPARPERFGRDGADSGRQAPRGSGSRYAGSRPASAGQRPRSGESARSGGGPAWGGASARGAGRAGGGQRGPADRRLRSQTSPRGDQFRSERPRSDQPRGDQLPTDQSRGDKRPESVWDQRRRSEPPTAQRRDSESRPRDLPKDQPSAEAPKSEPPAHPPEPPVADNPWTRRRPKSP